MSREERTRRYETMIVLRADLGEAGKEHIERIRRVLETNGGTEAALHEWGLRDLAYAIEKERRGLYVLAEYQGTAATVAEVERHLKLSDAVLRFVSVRREKDMPSGIPPQSYDEPVQAAIELESDEEEESLGTEAEGGDLES